MRRMAKTDVSNHHAHLMMTTRSSEPDGLGDKTNLSGKQMALASGAADSQAQLRDVRIDWEQVANEHIARAGLEVRIDHRSHLERGLEIEPTQHMGVHATQMERRGKAVSRRRLDEDSGAA